MSGVMKTNSSWMLLELDLLLKSIFSMGTFIRPGQPPLLLPSLLLIIPPMTAVSPSLTIIKVSACLLRMERVPETISGSSSVTLISILIRPST